MNVQRALHAVDEAQHRERPRGDGGFLLAGEQRVEGARHQRALLNVIGVVMVLSASSVASLTNYGLPWYFFFRQIMWTLLGLGAFVFAVRFDYRRWRGLVRPLLIVSVVLLVVVLVPGIGIYVSGSRRWLGSQRRLRRCRPPQGHDQGLAGAGAAQGRLPGLGQGLAEAPILELGEDGALADARAQEHHHVRGDERRVPAGSSSHAQARDQQGAGQPGEPPAPSGPVRALPRASSFETPGARP